MCVVGRDDRRAPRHHDALEQDQLRVEVGFLRRMIIHVVACEVCEPSHGDAHAIDAMLVEAVRGGLHREMRDAVLGEAIERARKLDRIRRRERAVGFHFRRDEADGADARRLAAERCPDLACERRDRCLAAGARDGGDYARLAWMESRGRHRERTAHIGGAHERNPRG